MKKNYIFKFSLVLIPFLAFVLMSQSAGRTAGFNTGSPGDSGNTCTQCHSGGSFTGTPSITTNIPATGYALNTDYTISLNLAGTNAPRVGYQLTAEKISNNSKAGSFTAGSNAQVFNNNNHVTHTSPLGTGGNFSLDITWKSPATDQGEIKFYAAINAVDGNGSTSGDNVFTTSSSGVSVLGISEAKRLSFEMYPNPASEELKIQLPIDSDNAVVEFYDYIGRLALSKKISKTSNNINIQELSSGVYILKVLANDKIGTQKFIKK